MVQQSNIIYREVTIMNNDNNNIIVYFETVKIVKTHTKTA